MKSGWEVYTDELKEVTQTDVSDKAEFRSKKASGGAAGAAGGGSEQGVCVPLLAGIDLSVGCEHLPTARGDSQFQHDLCNANVSCPTSSRPFSRCLLLSVYPRCRERWTTGFGPRCSGRTGFDINGNAYTVTLVGRSSWHLVGE